MSNSNTTDCFAGDVDQGLYLYNDDAIEGFIENNLDKKAYKIERERLDLFASMHLYKSLEFLKQNGLSFCSKFLDLGCGTGYLCIDLAKKYPGLKVYGIDRDKTYIDDNASSNQHLANLEFLTGDFLSGTPTQEFDCVNSTLVMAHMQEPIAAIKKMAEAVKPGGRLNLEAIDVSALSANKNAPKLGLFKELWQEVIHSEPVKGDTEVGPKLAGYMTEAGLIDIRSSSYPVNEPQDVIKDMIIRVLQNPGFRKLSLATDTFKTETDYHAFIAGLEKELSDSSLQVTLYNMYQVSAQKPLK